MSRAEWFAENILPLEPKVRAWLRKGGWTREETEDLIQESYAKLAAAFLSDRDRPVDQPSAYFFRTIRNTANDYLRRKRIVSIRSVADISRLAVLDEAFDPETELSAHQELESLKAAIENLPERCREVLVLRKIEGLSQAETAKRLGLSVSTVEKHLSRAIRLCADWLTRPEGKSNRKSVSAIYDRGRTGGKRGDD